MYRIDKFQEFVLGKIAPRQNQQNSRKNQLNFFDSTFAMMGYVAKADGSISHLEISVAEDVMHALHLNSSQKRQAIHQFEEGKKDSFSMEHSLLKFQRYCLHRPDQVLLFLEALTRTALVDGQLLEPQNRILRRSSTVMGYSLKQYQALLRRMRKSPPQPHTKRQQADNDYAKKSVTLTKRDQIKLSQAYELLGISEVDNKTTVRSAYLRQMNLHHPDKLISRGMSSTVVSVSSQKTQKIKAAYRFVKAYQRLSELQ